MRKWTERPPVGARVAAAGGFVGTVADVSGAPELAALLVEHPGSVWIAWDGSGVASFVWWAELERHEG